MEKRLFFLLNRAQGKIYKVADKECKEKAGLTIVQSSALLALRTNEPCSQTCLGKILKINKASVGALIERMQNQELIEKRLSEKDARSINLFITAKGKRLLKKVEPLLVKLNKHLTSDFNDDEIAVILRFLNHVSSIEPEK